MTLEVTDHVTGEMWEARETGKMILEENRCDVTVTWKTVNKGWSLFFLSFFFFFLGIYDKPWIKRLSVKK